MPRMRRTESQARTRETLVHTATELFLRDGYAATSLEKVADEAGYSKGAVYSNFRNKDELCLAVVDAIRADQAHRMAAALDGAETLEDMLIAFQRWAESTIGDQAWTVFEVEFATRARQDDVVRRELAERNAQIRDAVTVLLVEHAEEFGIELPMPAADCATALLSLGVGLGVQRAIDPDVGVAVLPSVIRLLAGGAGSGSAGSGSAGSGSAGSGSAGSGRAGGGGAGSGSARGGGAGSGSAGGAGGRL